MAKAHILSVGLAALAMNRQVEVALDTPSVIAGRWSKTRVTRTYNVTGLTLLNSNVSQR